MKPMRLNVSHMCAAFPRTTLDKTRIIQVISTTPCLSRSRLVGEGEQGPTCTIGALLLHAGVRRSLLAKVSNDMERWPQWIYRTLWNVYGLAPSQAQDIAEMNDATDAFPFGDITPRHEAVMALVRSFTFEPAAIPLRPVSQRPVYYHAVNFATQIAT